MKLLKPNASFGNAFFVVTSIMFLFFLGSCATKAPFQTSTVVPAAKGSVKVKKDNNNNYVIKIDIVNLAEPQRLQPSRNTYVVWMETSGGKTKNIGQIDSSTGFLSKKLKASFETVSPVKPDRIFITAEDDATIQYPVGEKVLTTGSI